MGDGSGMFQEFPVAQPEEIIKFGDPVAHRHGLAAAGLKSGEIEVRRYDETQRLNFLMVQMVLCEADVGAARPAAGPRGQAHVGLG